MQFHKPMFNRFTKICLLFLIVFSYVGCNPYRSNNSGITFIAPRGKPPSQNVVWSPKDANKILVTASEIGPGSEVYILDIETNQKTILANTNSGVFFEAVWTPDGQNVLILAGDNIDRFEPRGWWKVHIYDKSADYVFDFVTATWSPNGEVVATFSGKKQGGQITSVDLRLINPYTKEEETIFTSDEVDTVSDLSWSPDGQYLSFTLGDGQHGDLYVFSLKTRKLTRITENEINDSPAWSPRGNIIVFENRSSSDFQIKLRLINPNENCEIEIPIIENISSPTWSPDGKKIGYIAKDGIYFVELEKIIGRDIYNSFCP